MERAHRRNERGKIAGLSPNADSLPDIDNGPVDYGGGVFKIEHVGAYIPSFEKTYQMPDSTGEKDRESK